MKNQQRSYPQVISGLLLAIDVMAAFCAFGCNSPKSSSAESKADASNSISPFTTPDGSTESRLGSEFDSSTTNHDTATMEDSNNFEPRFPQGVCQPNGPLLTDISGVREIADEGWHDIEDIVTLNGTLYWLADGVKRLSPEASKEEIVVEDVVGWDLLVTNTHVFWRDRNSTLFRASLASLPATGEQIVENIGRIKLVRDESIYYEGDEGGIYVLPFDEAVSQISPTSTLLLPDIKPVAMDVYDGYLYYIDPSLSSRLNRIPISGGEPETVATAAAMTDLAIEDGMIYFTASGYLIAQPVGEPGSGGKKTLAVGNGGSRSYYRQDLSQVGVVGDRVYYREDRGALAWVNLDGSDCAIVAQVEVFGDFNNLKWVIDDENIYVIEMDMILYAIPR